MATVLTTGRHPDRSKIDLANETEARYWARKLGVDLKTLERTIEKVGDSAAAVRKELAAVTR